MPIAEDINDYSFNVLVKKPNDSEAHYEQKTIQTSNLKSALTKLREQVRADSTQP